MSNVDKFKRSSGSVATRLINYHFFGHIKLLTTTKYQVHTENSLFLKDLGRVSPRYKCDQNNASLLMSNSIP